MAELSALRKSAAAGTGDAAWQDAVKNLTERIEAVCAEAGVSGVSVQKVWLDSRRTLYSRTGEWLGPLCGLTLLVLILPFRFQGRDTRMRR
jgi:hypothetical protein